MFVYELSDDEGSSWTILMNIAHELPSLTTWKELESRD